MRIPRHAGLSSLRKSVRAPERPHGSNDCHAAIGQAGHPMGIAFGILGGSGDERRASTRLAGLWHFEYFTNGSAPLRSAQPSPAFPTVAHPVSRAPVQPVPDLSPASLSSRRACGHRDHTSVPRPGAPTSPYGPWQRLTSSSGRVFGGILPIMVWYVTRRAFVSEGPSQNAALGVGLRRRGACVLP